MAEAGTGFSRGFFGCFGVLAAIVFSVLALATCGGVVGALKNAEPEADVSSLASDNTCELALLLARERYAGQGANAPDVAPAPSAAGLGPFACRWTKSGGVFVLSADRICATARDPGCVQLRGLTLDGVSVYARRRD